MNQNKQLIFLQDEPRGPSQLVEVDITANGLQRKNFPDQQELRSTTEQKIIVKAIRLITADVLTNSILSGNPTAPTAELQKMALVIYCEGWEKAQYIPILTLNDMSLPGGTNPHNYSMTKFDNWVNVDWPKSYIQFANGTVSANAPYTVMIDVLYIKLDAQGNLIKGAS